MLSVSFSLNAQGKQHKIKLKATVDPISTDFQFSEILDKRVIRDNIGYVQKGLANKKVPAVFEKSLETSLGVLLDEIIVPVDPVTSLSCIIHEFTVSELTTFNTEKGICRISMEIARKKGSSYYSLGTFYAEVEEGRMDATKSHINRICAVLQRCLLDFNLSGWRESEGYLIDLSVYTGNCQLAEIPEPGIYSSLNAICGGLPGEPLAHSLVSIDFKKADRYELVSSGDSNTRNAMFVSDGEDIYMHASRYSYQDYFIKAIARGRYLYFEDFTSSSPSLSEVSPVGGLLTTSVRGIIVDTSTGKISILTDGFMEKLVEDHPSIGPFYNQSKKELSDKKRVILELNKLSN